MPVGPWDLEQGREALQLRVSEEDRELVAHQAVADVVVPVAVRAERRLGVVGMECTEAIQADPVVEVGEQGVENDGIGDVDARHEQMAGIEANTEPLVSPECVHDQHELVE